MAGSKRGGMRHKIGPHHGVRGLGPISRLGSHIDEDGAEQRKRDADAGQDEIFPRGLDRRVGAVDADHEHGGQRGKLDRHPHHADIVAEQREVRRQSVSA